MSRTNTAPAPQTSDQQNTDELLESAENLKGALRDALMQTNSLIAGLKRHRQQSKKIRSAMQSLKQLQALDA